MIEPHLTVWFDLAPKAAAKRLSGLRTPDRFESEPTAFFQRVAQGYADRQQENPDRFSRIDAMQSREAVWQSIRHVMVKKGWLVGDSLP